MTAEPHLQLAHSSSCGVHNYKQHQQLLKRGQAEEVLLPGSEEPLMISELLLHMVWSLLEVIR